jgi:hypothetical protein
MKMLQKNLVWKYLVNPSVFAHIWGRSAREKYGFYESPLGVEIYTELTLIDHLVFDEYILLQEFLICNLIPPNVIINFSLIKIC